MKTLSTLWIQVLVLTGFFSLVLAQEKTSTGFYWPTGSSSYSRIYTSFLDNGCSPHRPGYEVYPFPGQYHLGEDIPALVGTAVYSIDDGVVIEINSGSGWGSGNVGLFIKSYLADGTPYIQLHGHVRTSLKKGDPVKAGEKIATVGPFVCNSGPCTHNHFGILLGEKVPITDLGRMSCSSWPQGSPKPNFTNGFVDPIEWITVQIPVPNCRSWENLPSTVSQARQHPNGTLIKGSGPTVYLLSGGKKRGFGSVDS